MVRTVTVIARAAGFVHPPPGDQIRCARVGRGILAGDVADRIVIIVLGIGATDGVQAVEFITFGLYALRYEIKVSEL